MFYSGKYAVIDTDNPDIHYLSKTIVLKEINYKA